MRTWCEVRNTASQKFRLTPESAIFAGAVVKRKNISVVTVIPYCSLLWATDIQPKSFHLRNTH